jgi:P27 family predicted phage terminase small subunit
LQTFDIGPPDRTGPKFGISPNWRFPGALDKAPPAPAWLPKFAKTEWARVVPALVKARSLAAHELSTVESYCIAVARIRECEAVVQKHGLTFVSPTGESKRRPKTTLLKENIEAARRLAAECGITPASRSKNKGGATDDDNEGEFGVDI